jgi:hypothetical protein
MKMLANKRILVTGLLSNRSIAYGVAKAMQREGAELAFTSFLAGKPDLYSVAFAILARNRCSVAAAVSSRGLVRMTSFISIEASNRLTASS